MSGNPSPRDGPEPLVVPWQGRQLRVRHDDPRLSPYSLQGATIRSAIGLASDVEWLRLAQLSVLGDRYRVKVTEDGTVVGLWRRQRPGDFRGSTKGEDHDLPIVLECPSQGDSG